MTELPRVGELVDAHREQNDQALYAVTTLLNQLERRALLYHAVNTVAERAVDKLAMVQRRLDEEGRESAIELVREFQWDTAGLLSDAALGTVAHKLCQLYALTGERPRITGDEHPKHKIDGSVLAEPDRVSLRRMLDQFDRFLDEFQPDYYATEVTVYHPRYGYAGQLDLIARIGGELLLGDYKFSRSTYDRKGNLRRPYPENSLQVTAYRNCTHAAVFRARKYEANSRRYYLLSPAERAAAVPVPDVDGAVIIRCSPDHLGVYPVRSGERQWKAFLYLIEVARWQLNEANHVIGNEMSPPHPRPVPEDDPFAGLPT